MQYSGIPQIGMAPRSPNCLFILFNSLFDGDSLFSGSSCFHNVLHISTCHHFVVSYKAWKKCVNLRNNSLKNKTRVLLCKRLSGQCRDVYMVVYFHLHWWWWAVVDCAVLYWAVLGCTGLNWAVLDCTGLY